MGIYCEINLFKTPEDGVFTPGSKVSGIIKYSLDQVTVFDKITISLNGQGNLVVRERNNKNNDTYTNKEVYAHIDNVIDNGKGNEHGIGMYETTFDFIIPDDVPSTLHYHDRNGSYSIKCDIAYYIKIKFERPGFLQFPTKFKKEFIVNSEYKPTLPNEPLIYGEQTKLFQFCASRNNIVNIKAKIKNSVIPIGGNIYLEYEVTNDTDKIVKSVEVKLVEDYVFTTKSGRKFNLSKDVDKTDTKTGTIESDEKENLNTVVNVPSDIKSERFSKIAFRNFIVRLTVGLPFPHFNLVLDIPVEICDDEIGKYQDSDAVGVDREDPPGYDSPPPYWVAMGAVTKEDAFFGEKTYLFDISHT
ncbi:uncharacterized protein LOC132902853 [Amyelois transitella]|uniref:uncharacterized protein LOC132902853 n=1 Tax=Amyelois transitella TaxID=680683 RepID=UPI00298FBA1B|nr:uncharacterized protein LOC132902853 [Amyelois transitella]